MNGNADTDKVVALGIVKSISQNIDTNIEDVQAAYK